MPKLSVPQIDILARKLMQAEYTRKQAQKAEDKVKQELREAMLPYRTEYPEDRDFEFDSVQVKYVRRKTAANKERLLELGVSEELYAQAQGESESMSVKVL